MNEQQHWEHTYANRAPDELGWYTPRLATSLDWIQDLGLEPGDAIIDVGCGASTLVDDLLDAGFQDITLVDLANAARRAVQSRLGQRFAQVTMLTGDITRLNLPAGRFRLWHDRAVYHFLTDEAVRKRYRQALLNAVQPDGWLLIGTFAPEAPPRCSGLPVQRYGIDELCAAFEPDFELHDDKRQLHVTPGGAEQMYQFALFRRTQGT